MSSLVSREAFLVLQAKSTDREQIENKDSGSGEVGVKHIDITNTYFIFIIY